MPVRARRPDEVLAQLSDALSIIATASDALQGAEDREGVAKPAQIVEHIVCLQHGVEQFRRAYEAMDVALRAVTP